MVACSGLPERVRSMEGLGVAGGTTALALAAETLTEAEQRDTLRICVEFTNGSVPEPNQTRNRLGVPEFSWSRCFLSGERPAEGRAATTRLGSYTCQRWRWRRGGGSMRHGHSGTVHEGET